MEKHNYTGPSGQNYGTGEATLKQTALSEAHEVLRDATSLCERVNVVVDQIIGSSPRKDEAPEGTPIHEVSNGLLADLRQIAKSTAYNIKQANDAIDRLQGQI